MELISDNEFDADGLLHVVRKVARIESVRLVDFDRDADSNRLDVELTIFRSKIGNVESGLIYSYWFAASSLDVSIAPIAKALSEAFLCQVTISLSEHVIDKDMASYYEVLYENGIEYLADNEVWETSGRVRKIVKLVELNAFCG